MRLILTSKYVICTCAIWGLFIYTFEKTINTKSKTTVWWFLITPSNEERVKIPILHNVRTMTWTKIDYSQSLLLSFFEGNAFAELCAIFLKLDLAGNELFVLARPIDFSSSFVAQLNEIILRHIYQIKSSTRLSKKAKKRKRLTIELLHQGI